MRSTQYTEWSPCVSARKKKTITKGLLFKTSSVKMDRSYSLFFYLKKKYLYNVSRGGKKRSKRDTYKIQQAISKAINTTGPSVVTFFNFITLKPSPPNPPSSPPKLA